MDRDDKTQNKRQSVRDKDNSSNTDDKSEDLKNKENRSEGMDEDLDTQKGGSYGHKSQDNAEKNS